MPAPTQQTAAEHKRRSVGGVSVAVGQTLFEPYLHRKMDVQAATRRGQTILSDRVPCSCSYSISSAKPDALNGYCWKLFESVEILNLTKFLIHRFHAGRSPSRNDIGLECGEFSRSCRNCSVVDKINRNLFISRPPCEINDLSIGPYCKYKYPGSSGLMLRFIKVVFHVHFRKFRKIFCCFQEYFLNRARNVRANTNTKLSANLNWVFSKVGQKFFIFDDRKKVAHDFIGTKKTNSKKIMKFFP